MQALIHPDLIVAAGFTDEKATIKLVEDLYRINAFLDKVSCIQFNTPKNILEILIDCGLYPSEKIFKKNLILQNLTEVYSSRDITNLIHQIIEKSKEYTSDIEVEIKHPLIEPEKNHPQLTRNDYISNELFMISLLNESSKDGFTNIISCNTPNKNPINIRAELIRIIDKSGQLEDKPNYVKTINILNSLDDFLFSIGSEKLYLNAQNHDAYLAAINLKALELLKEADSTFILKPFTFGKHFFTSLFENQCGPNEKFGSVCFDTIARVVAGMPKYELKPFRISAASQDQKNRNGDLAFRTHVTKSNEAIRLMFWSTTCGRIEFANVGNKQDLDIQE
jgi:hypothetical protein